MSFLIKINLDEKNLRKMSEEIEKDSTKDKPGT